MSCEYCKDKDLLSTVVCYIPLDNGDGLHIPVNLCPNCGAPLTKLEPLGLEQLKQMDGEPVWVEFRDESLSCYALVVSPGYPYPFVQTVRHKPAKTYFKDYGKTWLAYDRRPEQEATP